MLRRIFFLLCLVEILAVCSGISYAAEKPNIVFIMADDLGYGDLSCYGQTRWATPNIDRLAKEGLRFTDYYAGSTVCAPSRCCLMTGLHSGHARIRGNAREPLKPEDVTVAEVLKSAGYTSGLMGKWGLGNEGSTGVPTRQGFDAFFGYLDQHHAHNYYPAFLWRNEDRVELKNVVPGAGPFGSGVATKQVEYSHDLVTSEALKFVEQNASRPFFLYLAWTIPHANNEAGKAGMEVPELGEFANRDWPLPNRGHAAMIARMDRDVDRLMEKLKQLKLDDNTLVFFTSDNGPHREGGFDPELANSNGPLKGIKRSLTEGGIRVPMIARWPGKIAAGQETKQVAAHWDVLPTLAELGSASKDVPTNLDGISFAPTLLGNTSQQKPHAPLYWEFYEGGGGRALRQGDWKIVQQPYATAPRLYNLSDDLGEERDLAAQQPQLVEQLIATMDAEHGESDDWKWPPMAGKQKAAGRKGK
jgi:arylsulfatase A-like enzyme